LSKQRSTAFAAEALEVINAEPKSQMAAGRTQRTSDAV